MGERSCTNAIKKSYKSHTIRKFEFGRHPVFVLTLDLISFGFRFSSWGLEILFVTSKIIVVYIEMSIFTSARVRGDALTARETPFSEHVLSDY